MQRPTVIYCGVKDQTLFCLSGRLENIFKVYFLIFVFSLWCFWGSGMLLWCSRQLGVGKEINIAPTEGFLFQSKLHVCADIWHCGHKDWIPCATGISSNFQLLRLVTLQSWLWSHVFQWDNVSLLPFCIPKLTKSSGLQYKMLWMKYRGSPSRL